MFVRQKEYAKAIQSVRINIGSLLGLEKDEEAFIVCKELPTLEQIKLKEAKDKGEIALLEYFKEVLPNIIIEHNLYETEEKKMSTKDITDLIFEKSALTVKVIEEYAKGSFFTPTNKAKEK